MNAVSVPLHIGRIALTGATDALAARRRAERLFAMANLAPTSLGPRAILCVRRFSTSVSLGIQEPSPRVLTAWAERASASLDLLAARAARPAEGPVPANAVAVIFRDESELLACLARDIASDSRAAIWWWRTLAPHGLSPASLARACADRIEAVPGAFQQLASSGHLHAVAGMLPSHEARSLALQLLDRIGIAHRALSPGGASAIPAANQASQRAHRRSDLTAPWLQAAPELAETTLDPSQALLAGIALSYARTPTTVTSAVFAHSLAAWLEVQDYESPDATARLASISERKTTSHSDIEETSQVVTRTHPRARQPGIGVGRFPVRAEGDLASAGPVPHVHAAAPDAPPPLPLPATATEYAGVFYLVNVATALHLYADAHASRRANLELPVWDFLALVGERLVGKAIRLDPLWPLLAKLAQRAPGAEPGSEVLFAVRPWLATTLPPVREHLARTLKRRRGAGVLVCRRRGRIVATSSHVDVHFPLEELPIAIRLACLDRDPGWIPAAGRFIAFHFD